MTGAYTPLLAALIALLVGLAVGKAWERYKLRDGRWFDRRKARETPHYMLGLNFLVSNQPDLAIEELTKAATVDSDALEIDLILGNLYREKGQVGRAIQVHQTLLQRPKLKRLEHAYALLCLGLDYKSGGFVDRALEAFNEVLRLDPDNEYALLNLEKLHEEQHQWQDAYAIRQRRARAAGKEGDARSSETLAFLENELGLQALAQGDRSGAAARFNAAIDLDPRAVPAHLHLGDVQLQLGRTAEAAATWERAVAMAPDRAYLAFDRLESAYVALGNPDRFPALCRQLVAAAPKDWRGRVALAKHLAGHGQAAEALGLLFEALSHHPHGLAVHRAVWQTLRQLGLDPALVDRYVDLAGKAIFYLDPHVCTHCRYRSTELLWHCPHCHEWNSFVEERMAAAKDGDEADG
jgi:lipopolysaccharide biosynthesis regulator YciM